MAVRDAMVGGDVGGSGAATVVPKHFVTGKLGRVVAWQQLAAVSREEERGKKGA